MMKKSAIWFLFIVYAIINIVFISMCITGTVVVNNINIALLGIAGILVSVSFGEIVLKKKS